MRVGFLTTVDVLQNENNITEKKKNIWWGEGRVEEIGEKDVEKFQKRN